MAAGVTPEITTTKNMSRLIGPLLQSIAGSSSLHPFSSSYRYITMNRQLYRLAHQHASKLVLAAAAATLWTLFETPVALAQPTKIVSGGTTSYQFDFNKNAGPVAPAGSGSWLTAVISPLATDGQSSTDVKGVQIKLIGNLTDPDEFITSVGFNLDPSISDLELVSCSGAITCADVGLLQADPDKQPPELNFSNEIKGLDIAFDLPTSNGNGSDRFQGNDIAIFELYAIGLEPRSFRQPISSSGPLSAIYAAAKVQGIKGDPGSTTLAASVPGPLPLLGVGVALGYSRRLRQRLGNMQGLGCSATGG